MLSSSDCRQSSALMIFDRHANLKYKFGNKHLWSEGYYVRTVGLNEATIKKYIQDQEKYDIMQDKLSVKEYEAPFKGGGDLHFRICIVREEKMYFFFRMCYTIYCVIR